MWKKHSISSSGRSYITCFSDTSLVFSVMSNTQRPRFRLFLAVASPWRLDPKRVKQSNTATVIAPTDPLTEESERVELLHVGRGSKAMSRVAAAAGCSAAASCLVRTLVGRDRGKTGEARPTGKDADQESGPLPHSTSWHRGRDIVVFLATTHSYLKRQFSNSPRTRTSQKSSSRLRHSTRRIQHVAIARLSVQSHRSLIEHYFASPQYAALNFPLVHPPGPR